MNAQDARDLAFVAANNAIVARMNRIDSAIKKSVHKGRSEVWIRSLDAADIKRLHPQGFQFRCNWLCRIFGGAIVSWEPTRD